MTTRAEPSEGGLASPSAADIAAELSNPNSTLGTMNFNVDYVGYDGDLPGAGDQTATRIIFQPSLPYPIDKTTNLFLRPAIPLIVEQDVPTGIGKYDTARMELGDVGFDLAMGKTLPKGVVLIGGLVGTLPTATSDDIGRDQWMLGMAYSALRHRQRSDVLDDPARGRILNSTAAAVITYGSLGARIAVIPQGPDGRAAMVAFRPRISFAPTHTLSEVVQQLSQQGIGVAALLKRARFPAEALEGERGLAPLVPFLCFIDLVAEEQGLPGLGLRLGLREGWADWSPIDGDLRFPCPLGAFVRRSVRALNRPWTGAEYWFDRDDRHLLLNWRGLDDVPGRSHADGFVLAQCLSNVRQFLGKEWSPPWVVLRTGRDAPAVLANLIGCEVLAGTTHSTLPIPLESLSRLPTDAPAFDLASRRGADVSSDFVEQTRLFIAVALPDRMASLSNAARAAGLSQRSLQRALRERRVSFGQLLDDVRVELALRILSEPDSSVADVALELGYSNPSNFTRAFRRRLGCAPSNWRRATLNSEGARTRWRARMRVPSVADAEARPS